MEIEFFYKLTFLRVLGGGGGKWDVGEEGDGDGRDKNVLEIKKN